MVRTTFSGQEIVSVLTGFGYIPQSHKGSHVRLRYENPDTGEVRLVDVPLHDEVAIGTLHSIADQCGAEEFHNWCRWIDAHS
ncbi:MAG: type II toxin-antitoxin system HicA family toxin [Euryarchaeota archaeon]|jgi:predicted RNA binding protein YcfA (HicA-like mRNA interferase family)|nr:type II toxin-antitoxin system HicA family toxin [Euryarchaeota archaeon]